MIEHSELVGRLLFCRRTETFHRVKKINDPIPDAEDLGPTMTVHNLFFDQELKAVFVGDIGEDFWLIEADYPQEKIDKVHEFVRLRDEANPIITELELSHDEEIPF